MLFKNILVPYDGSGHSKHAFKVALDMDKKIQFQDFNDYSLGYFTWTLGSYQPLG